MPSNNDHLARRIRDSARTITSLGDDLNAVSRACDVVREVVQNNSAVLTCGNGGSAAEALHLAEELVGRYRANRPPIPALCLNADPTALTCIANDFGFEEVFARQIAALARQGDCLVVFSTSGNSANIVAALRAARREKCLTIGLLGKGGGEAKALCDHAVVIASDDTAHIQEAHQVILHLILECVESQRS